MGLTVWEGWEAGHRRSPGTNPARVLSRPLPSRYQMAPRGCSVLQDHADMVRMRGRGRQRKRRGAKGQEKSRKKQAWLVSDTHAQPTPTGVIVTGAETKTKTPSPGPSGPDIWKILKIEVWT